MSSIEDRQLEDFVKKLKAEEKQFDGDAMKMKIKDMEQNSHITELEIEDRFLDTQAMVQASKQWNSVAKPLGSLGKLENLIVTIAGIQGTPNVSLDKKEVLVYCADNGIIEENVSQSDSSVTSMVAASMAQGRANVNVMAASVGASVTPVDIGMKDTVSNSGLLQYKVMAGTENFARNPAMTQEQCLQAIRTGIMLTGKKAKEGVNILAIGEMGIGNTTTSSAVASVLLEQPVEKMTGRGAGLTSSGLERKKQVIEQAISKYKLNSKDAFDVLCKVGGLDIAAMAGTCIGGMVYGIPIVLDGFISAVAALIAVRMIPACRPYLLPSHVSKEPAAAAVLEAMDMEPVLHADMCLGEGTGAVLLFPLLDAALAEYKTAHTFDEIELKPYEDLESER